MPDLSYGVGAYLRREGNLPEFKLRNMWAERTPAGEKGVILQSRPGLQRIGTRGSGPVRALFQKDGVFGGDVFSMSGSTLYREAIAVGAVAGNGPVSIDGRNIGTDSEVVVTAGGSAYSYNGTDLQAIGFTFPISSVLFANTRFLYARKDAHSVYWSAQHDGRDIDELDFFSAESRPDELYELVGVGDEAWLVGSETVEPWQPSGAADPPFIRSQGRLYRKGALASGCSEEVDNTLLWVGNDRIVYRGAEVPQRISDHGIEERIAGSSDVSVFRFLYQGHSFFCVRLDSATFAYDIATGQWCEFASYGRSNYAAACAVDIDGKPLFGDSLYGSLWQFAGHDDDGAQLERLFTAAAPLNGPAQVNTLGLIVNVGQTGLLSGDYAEPVVEMRTSRDAAQTWGNYRSAPLGAQGEYRTRTEWRRLGMFDPPGIVVEIRCTAPVPFRVSAVKVNEPRGGRGR